VQRPHPPIWVGATHDSFRSSHDGGSARARQDLLRGTRPSGTRYRST
jgi:hypothetical protein